MTHFKKGGGGSKCDSVRGKGLVKNFVKLHLICEIDIITANENLGKNISIFYINLLYTYVEKILKLQNDSNNIVLIKNSPKL